MTNNCFGNTGAGDRSLNAIAALIAGRLKRDEEIWPEIVGANGKGIDAAVPFAASSVWKSRLAALIDDLRGGSSISVG